MASLERGLETLPRGAQVWLVGPRQPRTASREQEPPPSYGRGSPGQGQRNACCDPRPIGLESELI